jgi:uncharacterized protein YbcI
MERQPGPSEEDEASASEHASRQAMLKRISSEMSFAQKQEFGKGPKSSRSYLFGDLLQVVMRDGLTPAEHAMVRFGRADTVRSFRQDFQDQMAEQLIGLVEQATGQKVVGFASQIMFDPDVVISTFVFEQTVEGAFVQVETHAEPDEPA